MSFNWNKIPRPQIVRSWEIFKEHTFSHIYDITLYNKMMEGEFKNEMKNYVFENETEHIFRSTFLTQIFTVLEFNLRNVCFHVQKFNYQTFSVLDLKGSSDIQKAQTYLKKTIEINIGEYSEWNFIKDCQALRNNIVHNNSYFDKDVGLKENNDFENLLKRLGSCQISTFAQDMVFKKLIKSYLLIDGNLNVKLIENVSSLFEKLYNHIIEFNKGGEAVGSDSIT